MKRLLLMSLSLAVAVPVAAGHKHSHPGEGYQTEYDARGKVIWAEPQYELVRVSVPETECWEEGPYRTYSEQGEVLPMVLGGVVGGVIGHQFGKGRGQDVSTVAGSVIGSVIGHNVAKGKGGYHDVYQRRCEEVERWEEHQQLTGYRVKYKYAGRVFFTHTLEDPGKWIDIKVSVRPIE